MAPRVGGGSRRRPAGTSGAGKPLHTDDNLTPEEKAKLAADARREQEEAEGIQLMSVVAKARAGKAAVEEQRAVLKSKQDLLNDVYRAAKLQSKLFTRERIEELIKDSAPEGRRNVTENEAVRTRFRKLMGLPVAQSDEQRELDSRLPDVEREGSFWFEAGYSAGIAGHKRDAPAEAVAQGHDGRFDEGWIAGQAVLGQRIAAQMQAKNDAKAAAEAAKPPPEETTDKRKAREKAEEAKAREGLNGMKAVNGEGGAPAPELDEVQAAIKAGAPAGGDDFTEATPEELAAQSTRQAVQAAKAGDGEPEAETEAV